MSLYDDAVLVDDSDLSNWESKMPAAAQKTGAYAGKRQLAKNYLTKQLLKRGVDPSTLADPTQLKDAATFKELELIYQDMSSKADSIAGDKAKHYRSLFDDELETVILSVANSQDTTDTVKPTISSISLLRA